MATSRLRFGIVGCGHAAPFISNGFGDRRRPGRRFRGPGPHRRTSFAPTSRSGGSNRGLRRLPTSGAPQADGTRRSGDLHASPRTLSTRWMRFRQAATCSSRSRSRPMFRSGDIVGLARGRKRKVGSASVRLAPSLVEARRRLAEARSAHSEWNSHVGAALARLARGTENSWRFDPKVAGEDPRRCGDHLVDALLWSVDGWRPKPRQSNPHEPGLTSSTRSRSDCGRHPVVLAISGSLRSALRADLLRERGRLRATDLTLWEETGTRRHTPLPYPTVWKASTATSCPRCFPTRPCAAPRRTPSTRSDCSTPSGDRRRRAGRPALLNEPRHSAQVLTGETRNSRESCLTIDCRVDYLYGSTSTIVAITSRRAAIHSEMCRGTPRRPRPEDFFMWDRPDMLATLEEPKRHADAWTIASPPLDRPSSREEEEFDEES